MWNVNIKSFINFITEEYDTFIRGLTSEVIHDGRYVFLSLMTLTFS